MNKGLLFVLTGASSVGKEDIRDRLLGDGQLHLNYSISMTTRPKRGEEVDGRDYYFVNHKDFADAVRDHRMLEYTEFNGYYYGTPAEHVEFLTAMGKHVLISVEAQGVGQIRIKHPDNKAFFLVPTSLAVLEKQIRQRYHSDEASINLRMNKAKTELELANIFGTCVPLTSGEEVFSIIKKELLEELKNREQNS